MMFYARNSNYVIKFQHEGSYFKAEQICLLNEACKGGSMFTCNYFLHAIVREGDKKRGGTAGIICFTSYKQVIVRLHSVCVYVYYVHNTIP